MSEPTKPHVFAATQVLGVTLIDTGRTVAVRLQGPDGRKAAMLLPVPAAGELARQLTKALTTAPDSD